MIPPVTSFPIEDLNYRNRFVQRRSFLSWSLHYTRMDATFGDDFIASNPHHPNADQGRISVRQGDQLPGIPRQVGKGSVVFSWASGLSVQVDAFGASGVYTRGDEANLLGTSAGYFLTGAHASLRLSEPIALFAKVTNIFDVRHSTFGVLGNASAALGADYSNPRFEGPGVPRALVAGVDVKY